MRGGYNTGERREEEGNTRRGGAKQNGKGELPLCHSNLPCTQHRNCLPTKIRQQTSWNPSSSLPLLPLPAFPFLSLLTYLFLTVPILSHCVIVALVDPIGATCAPLFVVVVDVDVGEREFPLLFLGGEKSKQKKNDEYGEERNVTAKTNIQSRLMKKKQTKKNTRRRSTREQKKRKGKRLCEYCVCFVLLL